MPFSELKKEFFLFLIKFTFFLFQKTALDVARSARQDEIASFLTGMLWPY